MQQFFYWRHTTKKSNNCKTGIFGQILYCTIAYNVRQVVTTRSDFWLKMNNKNVLLLYCAWTHWGSFQCSPDIIAGFKGQGSTSQQGGTVRFVAGKGRQERTWGRSRIIPPPLKCLDTPLEGLGKGRRTTVCSIPTVSLWNTNFACEFWDDFN